MSNTAATTLKAGLIGYGFAGRSFHAPLLRAASGVELSAVASSDAAKVGRDLPGVEVFGDPYALIASGGVDLVVIASPNLTHVPLAHAAIDAGLHVVVDKPFTPTLVEARSLIQHAERRSVMVTVFQNRRWDSDFLAVRTAVESGRLGRIVHYESRLDRHRCEVRDRWREHPLPASGIWFDLGSHLVDQALQLFGLPESVTASFAIQRDGAKTDDWAHVVLSYGRLRAVLHCSMLASWTSRFVVHGTAGTALKLQADQQEAQLLGGMSPGAAGWGADPDPLVLIDPEGRESRETARGDQRGFYAGVVEHLAGRASSPVPAAQVLAVSAVLEAASTSAMEARSVQLDLSDWEKEAWKCSMNRA